MRWLDIVDEVEHEARVTGTDLESLDIPEIVGVERAAVGPFVRVVLADPSPFERLATEPPELAFGEVA